jgi:hypothetical protein
MLYLAECIYKSMGESGIGEGASFFECFSGGEHSTMLGSFFTSERTCTKAYLPSSFDHEETRLRTLDSSIIPAGDRQRSLGLGVRLQRSFEPITALRKAFKGLQSRDEAW